MAAPQSEALASAAETGEAFPALQSAEGVGEAPSTETLPQLQAPRPLRGVANVISLAARIRGQQKKANEQ
jgi:hypothetical protein